MADDLQNKLNEVLANPEMMNSISSLARSLGSSSPSVADSTGSEDDIGEKLQSFMSSVDMSSDNRINLLNALKPYMRAGRSNYVDTAIRILKLTRISSVLKDI